MIVEVLSAKAAGALLPRLAEVRKDVRVGHGVNGYGDPVTLIVFPETLNTLIHRELQEAYEDLRAARDFGAGVR